MNSCNVQRTVKHVKVCRKFKDIRKQLELPKTLKEKQEDDGKSPKSTFHFLKASKFSNSHGCCQLP